MTNLEFVMDEVPLEVMEDYLMEKERARTCPACRPGFEMFCDEDHGEDDEQ
jgi:hypothetical protein